MHSKATLVDIGRATALTVNALKESITQQKMTKSWKTLRRLENNKGLTSIDVHQNYTVFSTDSHGQRSKEIGRRMPIKNRKGNTEYCFPGSKCTGGHLRRLRHDSQETRVHRPSQRWTIKSAERSSERDFSPRKLCDTRQ